MYIILAFLAAVFSALTAILSKKGLAQINSHIATFIRTGAVLIYVWCFVFVLGTHRQIAEISARGMMFLVLSGVATGGSWLCYYKALSIGEVSRVTAIDKSSILLIMIFGMAFLGEGVTFFKLAGMGVIAAGTYLILGKFKNGEGETNKACLLYAAASAVLAALTSILAKIGLQDVDANLGTAIRTGIVFLFSGLMLFVTGGAKEFRTVTKRDVIYLCLSAVATSLAWLCYFNALRLGEASVVAPIDKLSAAMTIGLSIWLLGEKASAKNFWGAALLTCGAVLTLF